MTPNEFINARRGLRVIGSNNSYMSQAELARLCGIESGRTVRKWEDGERDIPGPVIVILHALLASDAVREHFGVELTHSAHWPDGNK